MSEPLPPGNERGADTNVQPGLPPMPAPNTREAIAYQPVSGWAIGGLVASGIFALLVLVSTIVALVQGAPVFFPLWLLGLAIVGIVLSIIGQNHVQNSEGTRTGAKLATIGIWLGVISGLCYLSYYFATRYAQESQANSFLMEAGPDAGFFPLLREGYSKDRPVAVNKAFLLTRPITARSGNPEDPKSMSLINDTPGKEGAKGELSNFKDSLMARILFGKPGEDAEITPLAVQDWKYEKKSYQISRTYLIKTKEIEVEMLLTVASIEGEASGQGRKWFLNTRESYPSRKTLTRYGEGVRVLRFWAREWFEKDWLQPLNAGKSFAGMKAITRWDQLVLQEQKLEDVQASIYRLFESSQVDRLKNNVTVLTRPEDMGFWEMVDGKLRIHLHFRLTMPRDGAQAGGTRTVDAIAVVETRQVIDPAQFDDRSPSPEWSLIAMTVTHVSGSQ